MDTQRAVELFTRHEDLEEMVESWRRGEPDDRDLLRVETIELSTDFLPT